MTLDKCCCNGSGHQPHRADHFVTSVFLCLHISTGYLKTIILLHFSSSLSFAFSALFYTDFYLNLCSHFCLVRSSSSSVFPFISLIFTCLLCGHYCSLSLLSIVFPLSSILSLSSYICFDCINLPYHYSLSLLLFLYHLFSPLTLLSTNFFCVILYSKLSLFPLSILMFSVFLFLSL